MARVVRLTTPNMHGTKYTSCQKEHVSLLADQSHRDWLSNKHSLLWWGAWSRIVQSQVVLLMPPEESFGNLQASIWEQALLNNVTH